MATPLDHANELRALFTKLSSERQYLDFQPPALVSHAKDYASNPERLRKYAKQVISGRIMILFAFSRMNTQSLLQTYLFGVDATAPFPMLLAARSQLELLSVVADTARVIRDNSGEHSEKFAERVATVDEALINATFGTRSPLLKDLMPKAELSRLRKVTDEDIGVLTSRNVLTRLDRLSKSGTYAGCKEEYERLCEYVHPNWGMNMLHVVTSPTSTKLLRFSLASAEPFGRALTASAGVMSRAALGTLVEMEQVQSPFGMGTATRV